jgi:shikimate dehydrogenase
MSIEKKYAIIGYPLSHSLSPLIHTTAFRELRLPCSYESIEIHPVNLRTKFKNLLEENFSGFNVTLPYKQEITRFLNKHSPEVVATGAVNTIVIADGETVGHNTDIAGIRQSLLPFRDELVGKSGMILGTGGAAHAAMYCLLRYFHLDMIRVASRNANRALNFTRTFEKLRGHTVLRKQVITDPSIERHLKQSDLIINATPVGMWPKWDESPLDSKIHFQPGQIVLDLIYRPLETTLLRRAREDGARTVNGLEMLLHQAAEAFRLWTGLEMPREPVRAAALEYLTQQQRS